MDVSENTDPAAEQRGLDVETPAGAADARERAAAQRDRAAHQRDRAADQRVRAADQRERAADQRAIAEQMRSRHGRAPEAPDE